MTTQTFPSSLPNVDTKVYSFTPVSGNIRTEVDAGVARVRRRFSQSISEMSVEWTFTTEQLATFEQFYDTTLHGGADWFFISMFNGVGQTTYTARFKNPYQANTIAKEFIWNVKATLEVQSRPLLP